MHFWSVVSLVALLGIADVSGLFGNICLKVCTWQQWEGWSTCSRTCGGGMRRRVRALCGWPWWKTEDKFRRCRKSESGSRQSEYCNTLCFHGIWATWYGKCKCNDGYRGLCCQQQMSYWSPWSAWSPCSVTCFQSGNEGRQVRYRKCIGPPDNNVLRSCTGNAAQVKTCRLDVPCQINPTTMTTPAGDVTTLSDEAEIGGTDGTRPVSTAGYTTERRGTTRQESATETDQFTEHTDTTLQMEEDTTRLQTTTVPPPDRVDTKTAPYTNVTLQLYNRTTTDNTTTDATNRTLPLCNSTLTDCTVIETIENRTSHVFNGKSTYTGSSAENHTDLDRTFDGVNRTLFYSENTTELPLTVQSQQTPDQNVSMWSAASTSAAPLSTATWNNRTNNDRKHFNGTITASNNKTSTSILDETLQSGSRDNVPLEAETNTPRYENSTNKGINLSQSNTTKRTIQNMTSSHFEGVRTTGWNTDLPSESSFEEGTHRPEITTASLDLSKSSIQSLSNYSKDNDNDGITASSVFNRSVSMQNQSTTAILRETVLKNKSTINISEETYTSPADRITESTTALLDLYGGSVVVGADESSANPAAETTPQTFLDSVVGAIVESDHAKTNRSEREIVLPPTLDISPKGKNTTSINRTLGSDTTTQQTILSAISQTPLNSPVLVGNDTPAPPEAEDATPAERFIPDAAQTANDDTTVVMQNLTVDDYGHYDNVPNTTTQPDQSLHETSLPTRNALLDNFTHAVLDAKTTAPAGLPEVTEGAMHSPVSIQSNGTTMTPEEEPITTRSLLLDVLRYTTEDQATTPEPTAAYRHTTTMAPPTTVIDRDTIENTTTSTLATTKSPLIEIISRQELRFVIQPRNRSVQIGHTVVFECVTEPPSSITWSFKDRPLKEERMVLPNGVLILFSVRKRHIGKYTCIAKRQHVVKQMSAWIYIKKDTRCLPTYTETPSNAIIREGMVKVFACRTSDESRITWLKNGQKTQELCDSHIRTLVNGYLYINPVNVNDSAKYTCVAYNFRTKCVTKHTAKLRVYKDVNEVCGKTIRHHPAESQPERIGYIVGGHDSSPGAAPWQVMLYESSVKGFCGGVLVDNRWVITAAHCFVDFQQKYGRSLTSANLILKLGKHKRMQRARFERNVKMASRRIHFDFDQLRYNNDIALIELETEVEFSDYIRPICLTRSQKVLWNITAPGTYGTVTGWGRLAENGPSTISLNEVRLPLVRQAVCASSTQFDISDNMFCAGYNQGIVADACLGDSGGPFSVEYGGRWYLVGLVSWGEGCARHDKFGFYTNVSIYTDWLAEGMRMTTMTRL